MKCSLVEFSATALGGEATRAFLLFLRKLVGKSVKSGQKSVRKSASGFFIQKISPNGERNGL